LGSRGVIVEALVRVTEVFEAGTSGLGALPAGTQRVDDLVQNVLKRAGRVQCELLNPVKAAQLFLSFDERFKVHI